MNIKIDNCQDCPFCNNDNEYGKDNCNLDKTNSIFAIDFDELPKDKVHNNCPLKKESYIIELK